MKNDEMVLVKKLDLENLHSVPGIAGKFHRFIDSIPPRRKMIIGMGKLEPFEDMGWHSHPEEEVFIVIQGNGVVRWKINEEIFEVEVSPITAFYKQGNIPHQMVNTGDQEMIGIVVKNSC